jgi:hypothetical protein
VTKLKRLTTVLTFFSASDHRIPCTCWRCHEECNNTLKLVIVEVTSPVAHCKCWWSSTRRRKMTIWKNRPAKA